MKFKEMQLEFMDKLNKFVQVKQKPEDFGDMVNGSLAFGLSLIRGAIIAVDNVEIGHGKKMLDSVIAELKHKDFLVREPEKSPRQGKEDNGDSK